MKVFPPGNHLNWIIKEKELRQVGVLFGIDLPSQNIILLGKVVPFQNHAGNQRLQELYKNSLDKYYNKANRKSKTLLAMRIVQEILNPSYSLGRI
jgi:hypothetical protein